MITLTREEMQKVEHYIKPYAIVPVDMQTTQLLVNALRAKISEPEPVPTGFIRTLVKVHADGTETWKDEPFYTAPPQRKECLRCGEINPAEIHTCTPQREWLGLTDEDKNQIAKKAYNKVELTAWELAQRVGEFTEAKLKEKNA